MEVFIGMLRRPDRDQFMKMLSKLILIPLSLSSAFCLAGETWIISKEGGAYRVNGHKLMANGRLSNANGDTVKFLSQQELADIGAAIDRYEPPTSRQAQIAELPSRKPIQAEPPARSEITPASEPKRSNGESRPHEDVATSPKEQLSPWWVLVGCLLLFILWWFSRPGPVTTTRRYQSPREQTTTSSPTWIIVLAVGAIAVGAVIVKGMKSDSSERDATKASVAGPSGRNANSERLKHIMQKPAYKFQRQLNAVNPRNAQKVVIAVCMTYKDNEIEDVLSDLVDVQRGEYNAIDRLVEQKDTIPSIGGYCAAMMTVNNVDGRAAETYLRAYGKYGDALRQLKTQGGDMDFALRTFFSQ